MSTKEELSEWEKASTFSKIMFFPASPMIDLGMSKTIEIQDLLRIPRAERSEVLLPLLREAYKISEPISIIPKLMVALIRVTFWDVMIIFALTLLDAGFQLIAPLFLQYLLSSLEDGDSAGICYMWAALLSASTMLQVFNRHTYIMFGYRTGMKWKFATTALIHEKLIQMDVNVLQSSGSGTGMMVNMISNDVARFEEFPTVSLLICVLIQ